jgi:phage shock protein PspC (stress-responsive transcriptional regulator)
MRVIGSKIVTTFSNLGNKIDKSRFSFPTNNQLWVILLTLFASLAVVNVSTYLVIKYALIQDPEDDTALDNPDIPSRVEGGYNLQSTWKITESHPIADLDDSQFNVYVGFVIWATVVMAGIGLELLVWTSVLKDGWSYKTEAKWKFAEFAFPLLGAMTLGLAADHNYMALIFLVTGMFKFGFPEVLTYMYAALYMTDTQKEGRYHWISQFLNSVGLITHHAACGMCVSMMLNSVITPDRHIIGPALLLLMQHWFALLKYACFPMYVVLQLFLEFWFEWALFSEFQFWIANHWTAGLVAGTMLMAHWMLFLAGALVLVLKMKKFEGTTTPTSTERLSLDEEAIVLFERIESQSEPTTPQEMKRPRRASTEAKRCSFNNIIASPPTSAGTEGDRLAHPNLRSDEGIGSFVVRDIDGVVSVDTKA